MTRKTLIALTAAATLALGFATAAKADPSISFGIGFGGGSAPSFGLGISDGYGYGGGYRHGYYDVGYGDEGDCGYQLVKKVRWNYSHTYKIVKWTKVWVCN